MTDETLVRMANQIAAFFKPYPLDVAVSGVADHIKAFWEPRMRAAFLAYLAKGGDGLDPIARAAGDQLKSEAKA